MLLEQLPVPLLGVLVAYLIQDVELLPELLHLQAEVRGHPLVGLPVVARLELLNLLAPVLNYSV